MKTLDESDLANQLNVPRASLKAWRDDGRLVEGPHWVRGPRNAYRYTTEGIAHVQALLDETRAEAVPETVPVKASDDLPYTWDAPTAESQPEAAPTLPDEPKKEAPASSMPQPKDVIELTVTKVSKLKHLLICGNNRVKLRNNANFIVGMMIKARPSGYDPTLYLFEGRAPRFRGRW